MVDLKNSSLKLGRFLVHLALGRWRPEFTNLGDVFNGDSRAFKLVSPIQLLLASALGGIAGFGVISTINIAAASSENNTYPLFLPFIFIVMIIIYRAAQSALVNSTGNAIELVLEEIRIRSAKKLSFIDLQSFESLQKKDIQSGLTKHYDTIYNLIISFIMGANSATLLICLFLYLAYISWQAAIISMAMCLFCHVTYIKHRDKIAESLIELNQAETNILGAIDQVFGGFKELKFNSRRRELVFENISQSITQSFKQRVLANATSIDLMIFFTVINYYFAGCIVFILPLIGGHSYDDMGRIVALTLFIMGPFASVANCFQSLIKIKFSLNAILDFERMLDKHVIDVSEHVKLDKFKSIEIKDLEFSRYDSEGVKTFGVGPINLSLKTGQIIFIEGGNGSGKTTMMRLITGLYKPEKGEIIYNGIVIKDCHLQSFRESIGVIFADFFIFEKAHGFTSLQLETLQKYIDKLGLSHCVTYDLRSSLKPERLSTGEKKRLALALLLTEDLPILIFDEWAADQDPNFRRIFYREILPELKSAGKSIIAITHDDHYFDVADLRYHMEYGQMVFVPPQSKKNP
jgi:putative ATP-binding cassette transporter